MELPSTIQVMDDAPMTPRPQHRRMQELRKIGREYPFICPVDFKPHKGSPIGEDPNLDPDFVASHREDDGAHYLG